MFVQVPEKKNHRHVILSRVASSSLSHSEHFNDDGHERGETNLAFKCFSGVLELRQRRETGTKDVFCDLVVSRSTRKRLCCEISASFLVNSGEDYKLRVIYATMGRASLHPPQPPTDSRIKTSRRVASQRKQFIFESKKSDFMTRFL